MKGKQAKAAAHRRANAESERIAELEAVIRDLKESLRLTKQEFEHEVQGRVRERVAATQDAQREALARAHDETARAREQSLGLLIRLGRGSRAAGG